MCTYGMRSNQSRLISTDWKISGHDEQQMFPDLVHQASNLIIVSDNTPVCHHFCSCHEKNVEQGELSEGELLRLLEPRAIHPCDPDKRVLRQQGKRLLLC